MNRLLEPLEGHPEPPDDEQLELYALDLLDADERDQVEQRLADDVRARERVRQLRGVASLLALEIEPMQASPGLKTRILAAARADLKHQAARAPSAPALAPAAPTQLAVERERRRPARSWAGWAAAAALALALVGSLLWNAQLRSDLNDRPDLPTYGVTTSGAAVGTTGSVVVLDEHTTALLTLANLPPLERGKVYQVWLIADAAEPNATFTPDRTGHAEVAVQGNIADYQTLAVTVEPSGGSQAPTSEPIILSTLALGS
jgi:anti-sigma-K factor RskA